MGEYGIPEAGDIISNLPDAILHLILSFSPTKSVIRTSSLSRRWREISADHLTYANNIDLSEDFSRHTSQQVAEHLNTILSVNHSNKIDKLKFQFNPENEEHKNYAINWIKFSTLRGIKELDLDFCRHIHLHFLSHDHVMNREDAFELPSFLFDCNSFITVKLSRCILSLPGTYTGFGALQTLYLREVHVIDSMLQSLLNSCNLLEVLILKEIGSLRQIRIVNHTRLKRLTVYECYNASVLEISGPTIRSLLVSAGHLDSCNLDNMLSLDEVFVGTRGDEFGGVLHIFMNVLSDLAHVRALTLYLGHLVPSLIKEFQVNFWNLQELQLVNSPLFGLFNTDVYCFFRHCNCPSLQKISIELSTVSEEENFVWEFRKPNVDPVECVFNKLRIIELWNFRGTCSDIELASYLLERAPILEVMLLIAPKKSSSCSSITIEGDEPIKWKQKDMYRYKAAPNAEIRVVRQGNEHHNLSSFLKWHHVFDVYHK